MIIAQRVVDALHDAVEGHVGGDVRDRRGEVRVGGVEGERVLLLDYRGAGRRGYVGADRLSLSPAT